ncbi:MAG: hypothetical protein V4684_01370 [Pseudomonadota bacterium]
MTALSSEAPLAPRPGGQVIQTTLRNWCAQPPGPATHEQLNQLALLEANVRKVLGNSSSSPQGRRQFLELINGRQGTGIQAVAQAALSSGHPVVAASLVMGILSSGQPPESIDTMLDQLGVAPRDVTMALKNIKHKPDRTWAKTLASEIEARLQHLQAHWELLLGEARVGLRGASPAVSSQIAAARLTATQLLPGARTMLCRAERPIPALPRADEWIADSMSMSDKGVMEFWFALALEQLVPLPAAQDNQGPANA